jgi:hypothetical protein
MATEVLSMKHSTIPYCRLRGHAKRCSGLVASLIIGITCNAPLQAQRTETGTRIGLQTGVNFVVARDDRASPLRYTGTGPSARIEFEHGNRGRLHIAITGAVGFLRSTATSDEVGSDGLPKENAFNAGLEVAYLHDVGPEEGRLRWSIGGVLLGRTSIRAHSYDNPNTSSAVYGIAVVSVGLAGGLDWHVPGRSRVVQHVSVPAVSWVLIPHADLRPIGGWALQSHLATPVTLPAFEWSVAYRISLSRGASLELGYTLAGMWYRADAQFRTVVQGLSAGIRVGT